MSDRIAWFHDEPECASRPMQAVQVNWLCPKEECAGMMIATGGMWLSDPAGIHHRCNVCGFLAAMKDQYPKIEYEPMTDA